MSSMYVIQCISTKTKACTLIYKSIVEKMKHQFPTMKWNLKTDLVLL